MKGPLAGVTWRKSSRSVPNGARVETAVLAGGRVGVRDSKNKDGARLVFDGAAFADFLGGVKAGEFDHPNA